MGHSVMLAHIPADGSAENDAGNRGHILAAALAHFMAGETADDAADDGRRGGPVFATRYIATRLVIGVVGLGFVPVP